jgi:exodeoxyribonuclease VII small subunit
MADFERKLTALETVVEKLERGDLSLDESVSLFEEGLKLSNACKSELEAAEGRIQVLVEQADGTVEVKDLEVEVDVDEDEDEE